MTYPLEPTQHAAPSALKCSGPYTSFPVSEMAPKEFVLVVVRHGQGTHNLPEGHPLRQVAWDEAGDLDTELTAEGRHQAALVGSRLQDTDFHLAISSHLRRTRDTAAAILHHHTLELEEWRGVKERCFGSVLEASLPLIIAQSTVEAAVAERGLLTWRPPGRGGESVADVVARVKKFLQKVQARAVGLPQASPTVLVVSHYGFMAELHRELTGSDKFRKLCNTGVDQYRIGVEVEGATVTRVQCTVELEGCGIHLEGCSPAETNQMG